MLLVADIEENYYPEHLVESGAGWSQEWDEDAGGREMFNEKNGKQLKGEAEMCGQWKDK